MKDNKIVSMNTIDEEIEAAKKQAKADTLEHFALHLSKPFTCPEQAKSFQCCIYRFDSCFCSLFSNSAFDLSVFWFIRNLFICNDGRYFLRSFKEKNKKFPCVNNIVYTFYLLSVCIATNV